MSNIFFGDFRATDFWSLEWNASQGLVGPPVSENALFTPVSMLVGFGTGSDGTVYVVDPNDAVCRVPEPNATLLHLTAIGTFLLVSAVQRRDRSRRRDRHAEPRPSEEHEMGRGRP